MSDRAEWVWMPHPGHFICARNCGFHLTTCVGDFIVSTVGDFLPDITVREIYATTQGIKLKGKGDERLDDYMEKIGYEEVGCDRLYETMVFPAMRCEEQDNKNACCPYRAASWMELVMRGYNSPEEARIGHMELCEEWSKKRAEDYPDRHGEDDE